MKGIEIMEKNIGETPLEALERFRATRPELKGTPMTYAGRLDPMAEGKLILLWGDECKNKDKYLHLDKEYEVEVVFGLKTDSYDALGMAEIRSEPSSSYIELDKFVGKFTQEYPPYSSKALKGKQLHELARSNKLPEEMPTKDVEIYSIELLERGSIASSELKERIFSMIDKVKGDFRQEKVKTCWDDLLCHPRESEDLWPKWYDIDSRFRGNDTEGDFVFQTIKAKVKCSSGTYMRSLADRMGGIALTIKRTSLLIP